MCDDNSIDIIYELLDEINNNLAAMPQEERLKEFKRMTYPRPLDFIREIDGSVYAVRTSFTEEATENIEEKVQRILLKRAGGRENMKTAL